MSRRTISSSSATRASCLFALAARGSETFRSPVASRRLVPPRPVFSLSELQDSITAEWNPDVVSSTIKQIVGTHDIQNVSPGAAGDASAASRSSADGLPSPLPGLLLLLQLITFDESGVSLHPNHAAIAKALPSLSDTALSIFSLQTHAPPTKFVSFLSVLPPFTMLPQLHAAGEHIKVRTNYRGWWNAVKAMREHESQMEWYRWLYLAASRYLWVGEYVQVK